MRMFNLPFGTVMSITSSMDGSIRVVIEEPEVVHEDDEVKDFDAVSVLDSTGTDDSSRPPAEAEVYFEGDQEEVFDDESTPASIGAVGLTGAEEKMLHISFPHHPSVNLDDFFLDETLSLVPQSAAHKYRCVPLSTAAGNMLVMAIEDPTAVGVEDDLSRITGRTVVFVVTTEQAMGRALKRFYPS